MGHSSHIYTSKHPYLYVCHNCVNERGHHRFIRRLFLDSNLYFLSKQQSKLIFVSNKCFFSCYCLYLFMQDVAAQWANQIFMWLYAALWAMRMEAKVNWSFSYTKHMELHSILRSIDHYLLSCYNNNLRDVISFVQN